MTFKEYLNEFEIKVIDNGIRKGLLLNKVERINVRSGKLGVLPFGRKLGKVISSDIPFAIDYYGYFKKSIGLLNYIFNEKRLLTGRQLKAVHSRVVHFASIKMEDIEEIYSELLPGFASFKQEVLNLRGFK